MENKTSGVLPDIHSQSSSPMLSCSSEQGELFAAFKTPARSKELDKLYAAFSKAQGKVEKIKQASSVVINNQKPRKYGDIEDVVDAIMGDGILESNGLGLKIDYIMIEGATWLKLKLTHASGQFEDSFFPVYFEGDKMADIGSSTTKARRYALECLFNLGRCEDNDATHQEKQQYKDYKQPAKEQSIKTAPTDKTGYIPGIDPFRS